MPVKTVQSKAKGRQGGPHSHVDPLRARLVLRYATLLKYLTLISYPNPVIFPYQTIQKKLPYRNSVLTSVKILQRNSIDNALKDLATRESKKQACFH